MDETIETPDGNENINETPGEGLHTDESRAWLNDLPEDLKGAQNFNKFTKGEDTTMVTVPESVLHSYKDLESRVGQDKFQVPETDDAKNEFYEKLGWKEDLEEFSGGIKRAEMPEGIDYDEDGEAMLMQAAHANHLTIEQTQNLYDLLVKQRLDASKDYSEANDSYLDQVKQANEREFGHDLDVVKNRALTAMQDYNDPNFINLLETREVDGIKLGDHPLMVGFLAKLGKDKLGIGDEKGENDLGEDAADIQSQIDDLMADADYWDEHSPRYKSLQLKADKLFKRQAGEI